MPLKTNGLEYIDDTPLPPKGKRDQYPLGLVLGNYFHVGDKPGGVEPGFLGVEINQAFVDQFNAQFGNSMTFDSPTSLREQLNAMSRDPSHQVLYVNSTGEVTQMPFEQALSDFAKQLAVETRDKTITSNLTLWLIKQDYKDGEILGLVAPPRERLKRTNAIERLSVYSTTRSLAATLYKLGRFTRAEEQNKNAILESLAAAVAREYGMEVHNQQLILGRYENGALKIMTASVWENRLEMLNTEGAERIAGSNVRTDYEGYITEKNDPTRAAKIQGIGEYLALVQLQNDPDKVGSKGQNEGLITEEKVDAAGETKTISRLFGIDFGKAYRGKNPIAEATLNERNEKIFPLTDDFIFRQPKDENEKFKNLTIFYDNPLTEKMLGMFYVYQLADKTLLDEVFTSKQQDNIKLAMKAYGQIYPEFKAKIEAMERSKSKESNVFNAYATKFESLAKSAEQKGDKEGSKEFKKHVEEIREAQKQSDVSKRVMLAIFRERVQLKPVEINLLENLEKLTNEVSAHSSDGKVKLNHLRITSEMKLRWQMQPLKDTTERVALVAKLPANLSIEKLQAAKLGLEKFLNKFQDMSGNLLSSLEIKMVGTELQVRINKSQLPALNEFMHEDNLRVYKGLETHAGLRPASATLDVLRNVDKIQASKVGMESSGIQTEDESGPKRIP